MELVLYNVYVELIKRGDAIVSTHRTAKSGKSEIQRYKSTDRRRDRKTASGILQSPWDHTSRSHTARHSNAFVRKRIKKSPVLPLSWRTSTARRTLTLQAERLGRRTCKEPHTQKSMYRVNPLYPISSLFASGNCKEA